MIPSFNAQHHFIAHVTTYTDKQHLTLNHRKSTETSDFLWKSIKCRNDWMSVLDDKVHKQGVCTQHCYILHYRPHQVAATCQLACTCNRYLCRDGTYIQQCHVYVTANFSFMYFVSQYIHPAIPYSFPIKFQKTCSDIKQLWGGWQFDNDLV